MRKKLRCMSAAFGLGLVLAAVPVYGEEGTGGYGEAYARIMLDYENVFQELKTYGQVMGEYPEINAEFLSGASGSVQNGEKHTRFLLYDLNGDGTPELFIGTGDREMLEHCTIYAIYTFQGGNAIPLMEGIGYRRGTCIICEDGVIKDQSSGSAFDGMIQYRSLPENGTALEDVEAISVHSTMSDQTPRYYHDFGGSPENEISQGEYQMIERRYPQVKNVHVWMCTQDNLSLMRQEKIPYEGPAEQHREDYQAYAKVVEDYEAQYGPMQPSALEDTTLGMTGLCYLDLLDLNQDGTDELVLAYGWREQQDGYTIKKHASEIWSLRDGEAFKVGNTELFGTNGGIQSVVFTRYQGQLYQVGGSADSFCYRDYYAYGPEGISVVRSSRQDEAEGGMSCSIDGEPVSSEEWTFLEDQWMDGSYTYMLYNDEDGAIQKKIAGVKEAIGCASSSSETAAQNTGGTAQSAGAGSQSPQGGTQSGGSGTGGDTGAAQTGEYILPGSSTEILTEQQIAGMSANDIQMAINEIYARHGRKFSTPEIQAYFDSKSWYQGTIEPESFDGSQLTQVELQNIDFLVQHMQ